MKNKLTIHHLARRLPYGLKFQSSLHQFKYGETEDLTMTGVSNEDDEMDLTFLRDGDLTFMSSLKPIKPYLRPLSQLTEEEWNELEICVNMWKFDIMAEIQVANDSDILPHKFFLYCYENHIALDEPEGTYIPVTPDNNPYK